MRDRWKNQEGQASIMIGMMVMTFMLFFVFVINTGMLVNAKINLQNAADLAAYAGASTQARQLNHISYLNYEMRRQYKKFLFRYYVIGNMAQATHPKSAGSPGTPRRWAPSTQSGTRPDFGVPSVCIMFKDNDNYCQLTSLPKIEIPPPGFGDAITQTLRNQLLTLEKVRKANCGSIAEANLRVLLLWLFNTDPDHQGLGDPTNPNLPEESRKAFAVIKGMTLGLGILPRELILRQRIDTLASYVNAPRQEEMNFDKANALLTAPDNAANERAVQAFFSAYYTLGNHSFSGDLVMEELLPGTSDRSELLKLQDTKTQFATYALMYQNGGGPAVANSDCVPKLAPILIKNLPIGVSKDPKALTYYAVRLRAKAKVLFSPFGDVELKAYAAAQPFGSRIGPPAAMLNRGFTHPASPPDEYIPGEPNQVALIRSQLEMVPNLPILDGDPNQPTANTGWNTNFVIFNMFQKFAPDGQNVATSINSQDLQRAYQAAMVPNPWESRVYNIPTDLGSDPFVRHFDSRQFHSIWAPVFPANKLANGRDTLKQAVDQAFTNPEDVKTDDRLMPPRFQQDLSAMKALLVDQLSQYLTRMASGQGEDLEGINVARLRDPFMTRMDVDGQANLIAHDAQIMIRNVSAVKTSWNEVYDGDYRKEGRVGYSVKFVSFDSLTKNKMSANGGDTWTNDLPREGDADADIELIRH
jgi:hypothetical protein